MTILDQIITQKKLEVLESSRNVPLTQLKDSKYFKREAFSLKETLKSKSGIIAEFKRKSPSKGTINETALPMQTAMAYELAGASAISILTDRPYFGGHIMDLESIRETIQIPILRKDFMIDPYQFYEAKAIGADVVLLIAACLTKSQTEEFTDLAHTLGLEVLLEIHTEDELSHFQKTTDFVGINNRNLKDFKVDLQHSVTLKNSLPQSALSIAESGIGSVEDYTYLKAKGFDGVLMGDYFMRSENPGATFNQFICSL